MYGDISSEYCSYGITHMNVLWWMSNQFICYKEHYQDNFVKNKKLMLSVFLIILQNANKVYGYR